MGLVYYRLQSSDFEPLRPLIAAHESEPVGPRARGYWFEQPEEYDYQGVRATARQLDAAGLAHGIERLELSEVRAHSLSMLDIPLPDDEISLSPALFLASGSGPTLARWMKLARRKLGSNPEAIAARLDIGDHGPRFVGYLQKQVRHLGETVPLVWRFHERAVEGGDSVLVVDLRARDLDIPDAAERVDLDSITALPRR